MTAKEMVDALGKAAEIPYRAPAEHAMA